MEHPSLLETIFHSNVINFALVLAILYWLIRKFNLMASIDRKQQEIVASVKKSEEEKALQEQNLYKARNEIQNVSSEVENIINEANKIASGIVDRIKTDAEVQVKEIEHKKLKTIDAHKQGVTSKLSKDVAKAAFIIAEDHIKQALNEELHNKFINDFIDNLDNIKVK